MIKVMQIVVTKAVVSDTSSREFIFHLNVRNLRWIKQKMLSRNASAFMVDNLLGLNRNTEVKTENSGKNVHSCANDTDDIQCSTLHARRCSHASTKTLIGKYRSENISVELCQNDLWHSFHHIGTEMIITKSGRRMFPAIRVKLHGLKSGTKYKVWIEFVQLDQHKYRYVYHSSKWMVAGSGDIMLPNQAYQHPDSPADGAFVQSQLVSFERIKLTNHEKPRPGQISLLSMQRFIPRIKIQEIQIDGELVNEFSTSFPQTEFISVTAYQNQEITRLKIARNPFAKGFREAGKSRSSFEAMIESYGYPLNNSEDTINSIIQKGVKRRHSEEDFEEQNAMFTDKIRPSYIDRSRNYLYHIGTVPTKVVQNTNFVRVKCPTHQCKSLLPDIKTIAERHAYQDFISACQSKLISSFYPH